MVQGKILLEIHVHAKRVQFDDLAIHQGPKKLECGRTNFSLRIVRFVAIPDERAHGLATIIISAAEDIEKHGVLHLKARDEGFGLPLHKTLENFLFERMRETNEKFFRIYVKYLK